MMHYSYCGLLSNWGAIPRFDGTKIKLSTKFRILYEIAKLSAFGRAYSFGTECKRLELEVFPAGEILRMSVNMKFSTFSQLDSIAAILAAMCETVWFTYARPFVSYLVYLEMNLHQTTSPYFIPIVHLCKCISVKSCHVWPATSLQIYCRHPPHLPPSLSAKRNFILPLLLQLLLLYWLKSFDRNVDNVQFFWFTRLMLCTRFTPICASSISFFVACKHFSEFFGLIHCYNLFGICPKNVE